jgi:predicted AAA+ superfamily ATPase
MLVDGMNAAQGTGKTEAIAAAVTELAAQHDRLLELIESQPGMMRQMQMMQMMDMMQQMQGTGGMQGMPGR